MIRFTSMFKKTVVSFVLIALFTAITPFHTAYAIFGPSIPGNIATEGTQVLNNARLNISTAMETISASANKLTAGFTGALQFKEFALDPIAWVVAKNLVSQITDDLVEWINSGFEGQPMFVNRLDEYLLSELDSVAGQFLESLELGDYLCNGFEPLVSFAITKNYQQTTRAQPQASCTLGLAKENLDAFLGGGWIEGGGTDTLREMALNPANTPYGAYLEAQIAFNDLLTEEAAKETQTLSFGEGFLSQKACDKNGNNCRIVTPGQTIEEALTFQLSTGPRALITADEIDEIIGALLNQILNKALDAGQGLLGATGGGSYETSSSLRGIEENTVTFDPAEAIDIELDLDNDGTADVNLDGVDFGNLDNNRLNVSDTSLNGEENQELDDPRITGVSSTLQTLTEEQEAEAKALTDEAEAQSKESQEAAENSILTVTCESSAGCELNECPAGYEMVGTDAYLEISNRNSDDPNQATVWVATCQAR